MTTLDKKLANAKVVDGLQEKLGSGTSLADVMREAQEAGVRVVVRDDQGALVDVDYDEVIDLVSIAPDGRTMYGGMRLREYAQAEETLRQSYERILAAIHAEIAVVEPRVGDHDRDPFRVGLTVLQEFRNTMEELTAGSVKSAMAALKDADKEGDPPLGDVVEIGGLSRAEYGGEWIEAMRDSADFRQKLNDAVLDFGNDYEKLPARHPRNIIGGALGTCMMAIRHAEYVLAEDLKAIKK